MIMICNQSCFETSGSFQIGMEDWKRHMSSFCLLLLLAKKKTRWAEQGTLGQARFNELLLVSEINSLDEAEVSYFLNMFSPVYSMSTKIRQGGRWKEQDSEQTRYLDVNIKPILFCISKVQDLTIITLKTALAHCRLPLFSAHFQQQSHHEEGCSKISHL